MQRVTPPAAEVLEIDTPHGPARVHLHGADRPAGALVLGHGAGGGVDAPDLGAATAAARRSSSARACAGVIPETSTPAIDTPPAIRAEEPANAIQSTATASTPKATAAATPRRAARPRRP